jgi:predicted AAA+ superfamily ATPase
MIIQRHLAPRIRERLFRGKIIILTGARQVGKTTLARTLAQSLEAEQGIRWQLWNCDEPDIRAALTSATSTTLRALMGTSTLILIDEAQRVEGIGITLKLMVDMFPHVQVIATGSSALELTQRTAEPLTGRKFVYHLFPISYLEVSDHFGMIEAQRLLPAMLRYGLYPDCLANMNEESTLIEDILRNLYESYATKDVLMYQDIRRPDIIEKLLQALAWQIGGQVSFNELSRTIGVSKDTIARYIQILEQTDIIRRLPSFARNLRTELSTTQKIYFCDVGMRNMSIRALQSLALRNDTGALWENFVIMEHIKCNVYQGSPRGQFFWRTAQKQEIDFIETTDTAIYALECKWNPSAKTKFPQTFLAGYPSAILSVCSPATIEEQLRAKGRTE